MNKILEGYLTAIGVTLWSVTLFLLGMLCLQIQANLPELLGKIEKIEGIKLSIGLSLLSALLSVLVTFRLVQVRSYKKAVSEVKCSGEFQKYVEKRDMKNIGRDIEAAVDRTSRS